MSPKSAPDIPDKDKTRELLLAELLELKARNAALEQCDVRAERLEADLRKNEEMTRQLLEQKLYGVWVNVGDKVAYINEAGASILGASNPGEVVGKSLLEIIHPDYQGIVRDRIKAMRHGDSAVPMIEEKYVRVDGQAVDVDVWAMRFIYKGEPAFLVAFKDITERKQAEEAMKLTQFALDNFGDSAIWLRLDGSIVYVNQETCKSLGYSREELLSMHIWDIDPDYTMQKFRELWPETKQHGDFLKFESMHVARDGRVFPVEVTSCYTRYGDKEYLITFDRDITERKRADKALRESEAKYRDLVENANSIIIRWDLKGNLTFFNEFAEEFFGYQASEVIGKNVMDTIVPAAESSGRDLVAMIRDIEHHPERYKTNINENIRRNGERVWISWTNKAIRDMKANVVEILSVGNDITERKRAEDALSKNLAMLAKSQEIGRLASWSFDCDSEKFEITDEMYRLYGFEPGSVEPTKDLLYTLIHPDDLERYREYFESLVSEGRLGGIDYRVVWPDGSVHYLHVITDSNVRGHDGRITMMSGITQDITERKQAEEALKAAKAQAELYLDLMGHDINNIHQIALGYLEMARDIHLEAGQREFLDKPIEVLQRSAQLIRNVRKLQKLKEGLFQTQVVDVCSLLVDVQRECGATPHKTVTLNLNGCEQCQVRANELLHDVYANLVGNAIKHTGECADIVVDLDVVWNDGRQYCRVIVEDDGPGIPDDFKIRIFNRLQKGTDKAKGMGLGLYLVKSLVESYGGQVWVEDRVHGDHTKGAKFIVMLPVVEK